MTVVALAMSVFQEARDRAMTDVLVKDPPSATAVDAPDRPMQGRVLQNELRRAQGSAMQDEVRLLIGDESAISVGIAAGEDSDVFVFTGESTDPELAAEAADVYAATYIESRREALTTDLQARAMVVADRIEALNAEIAVFSEGAEREELILQRGQYDFELESLRTSIALAADSGASVIDAAQVEAPMLGALLNAYDIDGGGGAYEHRYAYGRYETSDG